MARFADRLNRGFPTPGRRPQLVHIATGTAESYGSSPPRFGEMALSYALHQIETNKLAPSLQITGIPRTTSRDHLAEIVNNVHGRRHGVERGGAMRLQFRRAAGGIRNGARR